MTTGHVPGVAEVLKLLPKLRKAEAFVRHLSHFVEDARREGFDPLDALEDSMVTELRDLLQSIAESHGALFVDEAAAGREGGR